MEKTALIIGAGPAGLTAAYELLQAGGIKPVILEKEAFVGGISRTVEHNDNRMDIGGHRFFSKSGEVMSLWKELMPPQGSPSCDDKALGREVLLSPGGPDPETEQAVLLNRSRVSRILYLHKFFDYPVSLKLQTILNLGILNTMRAGFSYLYSACFKRKEQNLEDFMINRFGRVLYRLFFENYTEKVWGRAPRDISAEWGEQRIKGLSLMKTVAQAVKKLLHIRGGTVETSLIENFYYPKLGPGQLWEIMAAKVEEMGGVLLKETELVSLQSENGRILSATVRCKGEERRLAADYVLSSMPVPELISALGDAVSDERVRSVAAGLPFRDFITVGILVDRRSLPKTAKLKTPRGLIPDCWIYVQETEVRMGRIQIFNNWSPYLVRDPEHTVWLGLEYFCNEGDSMWRMSDEELLQMASGELESIGVLQRSQILDSVCIKVKKAYPAYFGAYADFDVVRAHLDTYENLFCIGRNGQHRYNNMDHSMLTAIEAVREIVSGAADRKALWAVNAEQEYHEKGAGEKGA